MLKQGWICLNKRRIFLNMSDFMITDMVLKYVSYNTQRKVTLQVPEYLFRDEHIQNPVKDLRYSPLKR